MIAIKGMKMPESCAECKFSFYDTRIATEEERWVCICSPLKRLLDTETQRQDWCPLVETGPKWIPISERPPGAEHVLVTLKWGEDDYEVTELDYGADVACGGRFAQYVTAWMPLPEPYKEPYKEEKDGY